MSRVTRRAFIQQLGLAAGVGVPFLTSKVAMGQTSTAPLRVLFLSLGHGWGVDKNVDTFTGTPTNFTLPSVLKFLEPIKNQCVFVDGVRSIYWGNAHQVGFPDMLTCSVPYNAPEATATLGPHPSPTGPSLDWLLGNRLNKSVMRLSVGRAAPICFDSSVNRLPFHETPRSAWDAIINPLQGTVTNPVAVNKTDQQSLFDYLGADAQRLINRPNVPKVKLQKYLSSLDALGKRVLATSAAQPIASLPLPTRPADLLDLRNRIESYFEMIKIAFAYDTHRVGVVNLGGEGDYTWIHPETGQLQLKNTLGTDFHQNVAHYDKLPNFTPHPVNRAAYEGYVKWHGERVVNFVNSLNSVQDVDGKTLLDNTLIVLLGEIGNGVHDQRDMTYVVIGGGNRINRGRWLLTQKVEPRNRMGVILGSRDVNGQIHVHGLNYGRPLSRNHASDLWVSVARLAGVPINSFGFDIYNHEPIQL